jgi:AsmA-like C-terminal region
VRPAAFLNGNIAMSLESADLDPYLVMNGIGLPQMGTGMPAKFQANVAIDPDKLAFSDMKGQFADNPVAGALTFDRKAPNLKASGQISLGKADLGWLAEAIFGSVTDPGTGNLTKAKLGLPTFNGLDVNLKLMAKQMWPGIYGPISDFSSNVAYKGDAVQMNDIAGAWSGGNLSGRLMFANSDGTALLQTKLDLANADLAAVGWQRDGAPVATGRFAMGLTLEASGKSMSELAAAASGSGEMKLGETHIRGLNLAILPSLLSATDQIQGEVAADKIKPIVQTLLNNGEAVLGPLGVPFNISTGVVRIDNVDAANDLAKVSGHAEISLPDQRLKGSLGVDLKAGNDAMSGANPGLRLDFSGGLATPGRTLDVTDITGFLSLRAFERERRRVERLQASVLEKQRLRREVALYKFNAVQRELQRQQDAIIEQQRQAEEQRLRGLAQQAAEQRRLDDEARAKADAEAQAKADADAKTRAAAQAKADADAKAKAQPPGGVSPLGAGSLNFNTLPGNPQ